MRRTCHRSRSRPPCPRPRIRHASHAVQPVARVVASLDRGHPVELPARSDRSVHRRRSRPPADAHTVANCASTGSGRRSNEPAAVDWRPRWRLIRFEARALGAVGSAEDVLHPARPEPPRRTFSGCAAAAAGHQPSRAGQGIAHAVLVEVRICSVVPSESPDVQPAGSLCDARM